MRHPLLILVLIFCTAGCAQTRVKLTVLESETCAPIAKVQVNRTPANETAWPVSAEMEFIGETDVQGIVYIRVRSNEQYKLGGFDHASAVLRVDHGVLECLEELTPIKPSTLAEAILMKPEYA